jgi:hypothetical protein
VVECFELLILPGSLDRPATPCPPQAGIPLLQGVTLIEWAFLYLSGIKFKWKETEEVETWEEV